MPYEMVSILWSNVRYAVNNLVDKTIVIRLGDVGSALTLCFLKKKLFHLAYLRSVIFF